MGHTKAGGRISYLRRGISRKGGGMHKKCKRAVCVLMLLPFFAVLSLGLVACKGEARPSYALTLEYVPAAGI